ncbi:conserved hypothetical protein [Thermotomaculum hydrothermale]|uniref:Band 7 domain-containing protein n=1 Tax=Thermotomaculum hydrothermale TaxID=981385 RepID=A0A7R6PGZ2_9BACT|nr:SPFH domain-containing protein [Thermotomaculum hydrothermale]BBB33573.1 conserved hypothetical protein [Thermotomaculum hydrothermale]
MRKAIWILIVLGFLGLYFYTCTIHVDTNEVGVKIVYLNPFGETGVVDKAYGTGYHFFFPPFTGFAKVKKTEQRLDMVAHKKSGETWVGNDLKLKTSGGNDVWVDLIVTWKVIPEKAFLCVKEVGEDTSKIQTNIIKPETRAALRFFLGKLTSEEFYEAKKRQKAVEETKKFLNKRLEKIGLKITDILLKDYRFNERYQSAIEQRKVYEQKTLEYIALTKAAMEDAKRKQFEAKAEANKVVEKAKGELEQAKLKGDAILYAAQKNAEALYALKKAEANALTELNKALSGSGGENLVAKRLLESLKGKEITIIPVSDNGTVSFVDINSLLSNLAANKVIKKIEEKKIIKQEKEIKSDKKNEDKKDIEKETKKEKAD